MVQAIRSFTHSALGVFLCSLLLSDMIQGAAFAINFKWATDGDIYPSLACTAQASISQFGDLGSAIWSLAIAYHTFSLLFLVKKPPIWVTWTILLSGWALIFILPIIGPYVIENRGSRGPFYAVSGAWCWIGNGYQIERFLYVYMWIFFSLLSSLVLYGLVYLRFSGRLQDGKLSWKSSPHGWRSGIFTSGAAREATSSNPMSAHQRYTTQRLCEPPTSDNKEIGKHLKTVSKRLMLYPLVYSVVTLPVAACRIGTMVGWKPPFELYIFAGVAFTSSGLTNVLLFIATRHSLIRKVVSVQPQIRITTHHVTVLEDAHGGQEIHMHHLHSPNASAFEDYHTLGDKIVIDGDTDDVSFVSKCSTPSWGGCSGSSTPVSEGGISR
ncbi:Cyclic AMP receptor 1 [Ceratobasidium theobromae]|uniref:Cyclic AMP receptor 1 n=1 Tax=Ceratobasidium theobromae TaxID=1582974 RepID=A0A5N5QHY0_9AGAM|nr:Cyclic AMP receptor 1 [Ceratobasidium theobromae]